MTAAARFSMRTVTCVVWMSLLAFTPAAFAQQAQDEAFKDGLDAREAKKWQEVVQHMRRAIQADPAESARKVRRGLGGILGGGTEYLPHYFLAEALFNLGDCAGAVEEWSVSEQQGAVKARAESFALLQKGYALCEARGVLSPARYGPVLLRTRQQVTDVTSLAASVTNTAQAHMDLWRADMKEQYDRATGDLQNAQVRLAAATRTRQERDFGDASTTAERARGALKALEQELAAAIAEHGTVQGLARETELALSTAEGIEKTLAAKKAFMTPALAAARQAASESAAQARSQMTAGVRASSVPMLSDARTTAQNASSKYREVLDAVVKLEARAHEKLVAEAVALAQDAFSFVDGGFASIDRLASEKPGAVKPEMTTEREALVKEAATVRRRFETAQRRGDVAGLQDAARLAGEVRTRLDALIRAFGPVTLVDRGVRAALIEGARLFFAGEYDQALAALDPATIGDGPLQLHAHLLRAAAHYALFVRSGERDQVRRAAAISEVAAVKQINPGFSPDARAFAPRFISFFQEEPRGQTP